MIIEINKKDASGNYRKTRRMIKTLRLYHPPFGYNVSSIGLRYDMMVGPIVMVYIYKREKRK